MRSFKEQKKLHRKWGKNHCIDEAKREFLKSFRNVRNLHNTTGQEVVEENINKVPNRHKVFINVFVLFQDTMSFAALK